MGKLVFFVGGAGAGKTTLAKAIARKRGAVLLDMDTLLRPAAIVVMTAAGLDPDDRDSDAYKRLCRDLGYRITMDAALENVAVGNDVFVIGPFTREIGEAEWIESELAAIGASLQDVEVKAVVVTLADEAATAAEFSSAAPSLTTGSWRTGRHSAILWQQGKLLGSCRSIQ